MSTPSCQCPACTDDEERCCALVYETTTGRAQCGLPGGHDGSCDYFERVHEGNTFYDPSPAASFPSPSPWGSDKGGER